MEFGSYAFSTTGLPFELWMWCFLLGVGTLVWQQLVATIPSRKLPSVLGVGKEVPTQQGQVLWMRNLTRLQQQLQVVNAFKSGPRSASMPDHENGEAMTVNENLVGEEPAERQPFLSPGSSVQAWTFFLFRPLRSCSYFKRVIFARWNDFS